MELFDRDVIDFKVEGHSLREITNYNECLVLEAMREIYAADRSLCRCALCIEDVFALSLNSLPPRYIQATSLKTYQQSKNFVDLDQVRGAVREAAGKVQQSPNHSGS